MSLAALIRDVLADLETLRTKLEGVQAAIETEAAGKETDAMKKLNGRLTEAGVRRLCAMVEAGYTDAEISRTLEIRQSSVSPHRRRFLSEKAASQRCP
jgi:DNA-binding NarL/FixJ family response regulator